MSDEKKIEMDRAAQLERCIPDIFRWDSVLYVGISKYRSMFVDSFNAAGYKIDAIEVFEPNVVHWKAKKVLDHIVCADIRTVEISKKYDVVMWNHGPEHVTKDEAGEIFRKLKKATRRVLVIGCPWGDYPQGPEYGNENERHVSSWSMADFATLGFKIDAIGDINGVGSNLLAWMRK